MTSILIGALILSLLHAVIPNHWLPVIAIGRKEQWSTAEVTRITLICALAHGISTVLIGAVLGYVGAKLDSSLTHFTNIIAPVILVLMGLVFIYRHHRHKHFHINESVDKRKNKSAIVAALVIAMFFSPCMEIEAYFLLAGSKGWYVLAGIATMYSFITIGGMLIWISIAYKGLIKLNWHKWEHNAGIITGFILIATGIISFFIN